MIVKQSFFNVKIELPDHMYDAYYLVAAETYEEALRMVRNEFPGQNIKHLEKNTFYSGIVEEGNNPKEEK